MPDACAHSPLCVGQPYPRANHAPLALRATPAYSGARTKRDLVVKLWLMLIAAIGFEVLGTSMLKSSDGFSRLTPSLASVAAYLASFWLLSQVLRVMPVGIAYAIWSGLGILLITVIGWAVFRQRLDAAALLGLALIAAGIIVINVFSNTTGH